MRFAVIAALTLVVACSTYRDQLARGERAFDQNDSDRTLAIMRDLEPDFQRLSPPEQASYAYIRGMTDFSLGYKADARHWLSVASAYEQVTPGALPGERKTKTIAALKELNDFVYLKGAGELVNGPPAAASSAAPAPDSSSATDKSSGKKKRKKTKPAVTVDAGVDDDQD